MRIFIPRTMAWVLTIIFVSVMLSGCTSKPEVAPADSPIKPVDPAKQSQVVPEKEAGPEKRRKVE